MSRIECRELTKAFPEGDGVRVVLEDVSVSIEEGELVVLLGRSGSGKSTLLNLLSGMELPTSGEVLFDGRSIGLLKERERTEFRRQKLGFVFQFFNLVPTLTSTENIALPLELNGRLNRSGLDGVQRALESVGLGDRGATFPDRLSGGEQQRIAVARALIHDPEVILADEPTGNLDSETAAQVGALLEARVRARRKTLVIATHSTEWVKRADRVLTIENSRLVETTSGGGRG